MFGAPPEHDLNFDKNAVASTSAFLTRVQKLATKLTSETNGAQSKTFDELLSALEAANKTGSLKDDQKSLLIDALNLLIDYETKIGKSRFFHVAFARLMELTNKVQQASAILEQGSNDCERFAFGCLLLGLYPYAPHLASELWSDTGLTSVSSSQLQSASD